MHEQNKLVSAFNTELIEIVDPVSRHQCFPAAIGRHFGIGFLNLKSPG